MAPMPGPANHYDFIMNPEKPAKKPSLTGFSGNSFWIKIVALVVGALLIMAVIGVGASLFIGNKTNLQDIVAITQTEQELVRLSDQGRGASDQSVKNAAINTDVSLKSQQNVWLSFLSKRHRKVKPAELSLTKDLTTDTKLKAAQASSTFDTVYTELMRTKLTAYAASLKTAYNKAANPTQKSLLANDYNQTALLLKQWPE